MTPYTTVQSDSNPTETTEWLDSLESILRTEGPDRARYVLARLMESAREAGYLPDQILATAYVNTIPVEHQPDYPGDLEMEDRISDIVRWNAAVMVSRANVHHPSLGGHLSTYASSAVLYDVGFHHFFRGKEAQRSGDQVYVQGHAAPGLYARSFLEGRITADQMDAFRRESEPQDRPLVVPPPAAHARRTGNSRPSRWASARSPRSTRRASTATCARAASSKDPSRASGRSSETARPTSPRRLGALSVAAREGLDNLTWVVNCNLQRLDGPVRGNGKIVQELETVFRGAGWNVIKVLWASDWDPLFARDEQGLLRRRLTEVRRRPPPEVPHGERRLHPQALLRRVPGAARDRLALHRRRSSRTCAAAATTCAKVYAATGAAVDHQGRPTVVLAQTVKGFSLGEGFEAQERHPPDEEDARKTSSARFRDRLELPITDGQLERPALLPPRRAQPRGPVHQGAPRRAGRRRPSRRTDTAR